MLRQERLKLERDIQRLLEKDGDHCTLCRRPFVHGEKTYYGRGSKKRTVVLGDCCADELRTGVAMGLYTDRAYDVLSGAPTGTANPLPTGDLTKMIDGLQSFITEIDKTATDVANRAGVLSKAAGVYLKDTAWKRDDAAWFEANPTRSHRLRPLLEGEREAMPPERASEPMPEGHELQVVVRQVEPGQRIRSFFGRNLAVPIPDDEAVIHALFDTLYSDGDPGGVISVEQVAGIARRYDGGSGAA